MRQLRARANSEHASHALGRDAEALGGPLQVLAGVGRRRALGEHLVGAGERAGPRPRRARPASRVAIRSASSLSPSVMRARADSMATRRRTGGRGGRGPLDGAVDVGRSPRRPGRWPGWRRPGAGAARARARPVDPRRASRLSIGRASTVSATDSLRPFIIGRRPVVVAGVEDEADRPRAPGRGASRSSPSGRRRRGRSASPAGPSTRRGRGRR